ncbi:hypothetical protein WA158_008239 [Blastocystis sp. Blastoise]
MEGSNTKHRIALFLQNVATSMKLSNSRSDIQNGKLTPDEFIQSGDYLVLHYPGWSWVSGDDLLLNSQLPQEKQYLIYKGVSCITRVQDYHKSTFTEKKPSDDDFEEWIVTSSNTIDTIDKDTLSNCEFVETVQLPSTKYTCLSSSCSGEDKDINRLCINLSHSSECLDDFSSYDLLSNESNTSNNSIHNQNTIHASSTNNISTNNTLISMNISNLSIHNTNHSPEILFQSLLPDIHTVSYSVESSNEQNNHGNTNKNQTNNIINQRNDICSNQSIDSCNSNNNKLNYPHSSSPYVSSPSSSFSSINEISQEKDQVDFDFSNYRTYDISITYNRYYHTPHTFIIGYNHMGEELTLEEMLEDVEQDYTLKTVTYEHHPHLSSGCLYLSIHPCMHASTMASLYRQINMKDLDERIQQYLVIFLKFLQSVIPTMTYDITL